MWVRPRVRIMGDLLRSSRTQVLYSIERSQGALRLRCILRQWLASRQHVGDEQDHWLGADVAADVGMLPSGGLDERSSRGRHLGRAVVQCASQCAGLYDGDHLAVMVVPA